MSIELKCAAGYAERGRRLTVKEGARARQGSYSITIMTTLTLPAGVVCSVPRVHSNTAWDFLLFLTDLITSAALVAGDTLVLDNAAIHYSREIAPFLNALLLAANVRMLFLP